MSTFQDRYRVGALITGYVVSQAVFCVAALEIPDRLASGPRTASDLARETRTSATHLDRLMRALCTVGLFSESTDGYALTELSQLLCKDREDGFWPLAVIHGGDMYYAFGNLLPNITDGLPGWDLARGTSIWNYLAANPERGAMFDQTMRANHRDDLGQMIGSYDFSRVRVVVDVGGGDGSLLHAIVTEHENISGVVFDSTAVVDRASKSGLWLGSSRRCEFVAGNFFDKIPPSGDVYILRHVLHDWDDTRCVQILLRCREAMSATAKLIIIEAPFSDRGGSPDSLWLDLSMMVLGGQERTVHHYAQLLGAAHFAVSRVISVSARVAIIEAVPLEVREGSPA
jgi:hypothetical protein